MMVEDGVSAFARTWSVMAWGRLARFGNGDASESLSRNHGGVPGAGVLLAHLREVGVDAVVDQYNIAPPDGWPMWVDREIRKADFIALVCTETYLRRVEGRDRAGVGVFCGKPS